MLSFQTQSHFDEVYDCLTQAYESHMDDFEGQYGYLSDADFDQMSDQLGFVDEQPLIDFESALGFNSYRRQMAIALTAFLAGGGDPEYAPETAFEDDVMEAMVNSYGAVMVGGRINMVNEHGDAISFCDCATYEHYIADPIGFDLNDSCVVVTKELTPYCSSELPPCVCCNDYGKEKGGETFDNEQRKITWTLMFRYRGNQWWVVQAGSRAIAKIRGWKAHGSGWKPMKMRMLASAYGDFHDVLCKDPGDIYTSSKCKKRKTVVATAVLPNFGDPRRTFRSGEPKGKWQFRFDGDCSSTSLSHYHALTFDPAPCN